VQEACGAIEQNPGFLKFLLFFAGGFSTVGIHAVALVLRTSSMRVSMDLHSDYSLRLVQCIIFIHCAHSAKRHIAFSGTAAQSKNKLNVFLHSDFFASIEDN
jgi:hypothetical protein